LKNKPINIISIIVLSFLITNFSFGQYIESKNLSNFENSKSSLQLGTQYEENTSDTFYKIGFVSASTGLLFLSDHMVRNNIKMSTSAKDNTLLKVGNKYGVFYYNLGFSGALYLFQLVTNNKKNANTGKVLMESLIISGLASISIKYLLGRSRPYREEGVTKFNWFETDNIFNSLPSGHVITAFTTSTVLSRSIGNTYVSVALYGLAGLTAYQRMASDNHWFSDVFLGASIGILIGEYFSDVNDNSISVSGNYNLIPFFSNNYSGISFSVCL
jgi:membrane-associated phospholipid phosphatase